MALSGSSGWLPEQWDGGDKLGGTRESGKGGWVRNTNTSFKWILSLGHNYVVTGWTLGFKPISAT